jgi:hypothetical protein
MAVSPSTIRALAVLSGNVCAFPGCVAPVYDTVNESFVGEVCHIKAKRPGGPRYDANQTDEERDSFHNTMLMCSPHHTIIDGPANIGIYTVEVLREYKQRHESCSHNTIMTEDVLERLVRKVLEVQAPPAAVFSLEPLVEAWLNPPDTIGRIDWYDLRIRVHNAGERTVRDFQIEVEIPVSHANPSNSSVALIPNGGESKVRRYRPRDAPAPLYPDETSPILLMLDMMVPWDDYIVSPMESITVAVYAGDKRVAKEAVPIDELLKPDRREYIRNINPSQWDPILDSIEKGREASRAEEEAAADKRKREIELQHQADKNGEAEVAKLEALLSTRCEKFNERKAADLPDFEYDNQRHVLRAGKFQLRLDLTEGFSPYRLDMTSGLRDDLNFAPGFEPEYEPANWKLLAGMDGNGFYWECNGQRWSNELVVTEGLKALAKNLGGG